MRATSEHYKMVSLFMQFAGQTTRHKPTLPSPEERLLRARLILEEALETIQGLGVGLRWNVGYELLDMADFAFDEVDGGDLSEIADGCADLSVVTIGTLIACGIPDQALLELVDNNNLAKFGPGGRQDEKTGKWIKPPRHQAPDIAGLLNKLGGVS